MESRVVHGATLRTVSTDEQAVQKLLKERLRAKHRIQRKEFIEKNQDIDYSNFNKQVLLQIDKEYERILNQIDANKPIISAYWPTKFELDCKSLLKEIQSQNKWRICLPVTQGDKYPLIFREYKEGDQLEKGEKFKVLEPTIDKEQLKPHLLIVPLIAFTSDCFRIGYGKGHYDMTLETLGDVKTIGVAFESQKIQKQEGYIPEAHDKQLDCIITEKDIYFP
ncbi:hypothetical protein FGO68_gene2471 [Halteria grandinella]|uniref:5-formyltetrahydrofolate cyclo-ligase n=1 Tax=Halteria grandinella TaxID=5974 RepID=A0A8J8NJM8_HALGN|nr:hypothetical protein FGO68_gene2471 [Halteria grandinella]